MNTTFSCVLLFLVLLMLCVLMFYLLNTKKLVSLGGKSDNTDDLDEKKQNIFPVLFSVLAMIVSLIALAFVLPITTTTITINYWEVIIAIFSALITILIGWQIYNSFKIEENVRKAQKSANLARKSKEDMDESRIMLSDYINKQNERISDLVNDVYSQLRDITQRSKQLDEYLMQFGSALGARRNDPRDSDNNDSGNQDENDQSPDDE